MKKLQTTFLLIFLSIGINNIANSQLDFLPNKTIKVIENSDTLDSPWAGGVSYAQFSTCDLNSDGLEDLVVFDRADLKVSTYLNKGTTGVIKYIYAPEYEQYFPPSRGWLLMRDYNCDGKKDIFLGFPGRIEIHKNVSTSSIPKFKKIVHDLPSLQPPSGTFGIYISSDDIPAIHDIDGDGDLDILAFGVLGYKLEYNRNLSMETYGVCDSIKYELKNLCWGHFAEIGVSSNKLKLFDTCSYNVSVPEDVSRHVGSTVLAFENNGDSTIDILLGDVSYNNVVMGQNDGSKGSNQNTSLLIQDTTFPSYDTAIDLTLFPGIFMEDVDNDQIKDMICSPNTPDFAENLSSVWYYKNNGTNSIPVFNFKQKNFLQSEMINTGESAIPVLFDYNGDSLMDLVVSNYGYYDRDSLAPFSRIYLYKNIGTKTNPMFELITNDYQNISALKLHNSLHPTFGDLDSDGDQDMILGNSEGFLYRFTNTAGAGNIAVFTFTDSMKDNTSTTIDIGKFSAPQLFDYDKDSDLDLIIGRKNGTISYYENTGTVSSFIFTKITDSLGGVSIHEYWDKYGAATGYSTPHLFKDNGVTALYCGGYQGIVYKFTGINPTNPLQSFILSDTICDSTEIGLRTVPFVYDLGKDNKLDLFVGNKRGGIRLLTEGVNTWGINEIENTNLGFNVYPNPTNNILNVKLNQYSNETKNITIHNILGKVIFQTTTKSLKAQINVDSYPKGMYFITVSTEKGRKTKRFVVK